MAVFVQRSAAGIVAIGSPWARRQASSLVDRQERRPRAGAPDQLVSHILAKHVNTLSGEQVDYSRWDEAIIALRKRTLTGSTTTWLRPLRLGSLRSHLRDRPACARSTPCVTAARPRLSTSTPIAPVAPLIAKLQAIEAAGAMAAFDSGFGRRARCLRPRRYRGPGSFCRHHPLSCGIRRRGLIRSPTARFPVCVRFLDDALAKDFMDDYFIAGRPSLRLRRIDREGRTMRSRTRPARQSVGSYGRRIVRVRRFCRKRCPP